MRAFCLGVCVALSACDVSPLPIDSLFSDAGSNLIDAGNFDAGAPDSGTFDAGIRDAGSPDAGTPDSGSPDAGPADSGIPDAGQPVFDAGFGYCELGWCWLNPYPRGGNFNAVAQAAPGLFFTGGAAGTLLEWNDGGVRQLNAGTSNNLFALAALNGSLVVPHSETSSVRFYSPATGAFSADVSVMGSDFLDSDGVNNVFSCGYNGCSRLQGGSTSGATFLGTHGATSLSAVGDEAFVQTGSCIGDVLQFNGIMYSPLPKVSGPTSVCWSGANSFDDAFQVDFSTLHAWAFDGGTWTQVSGVPGTPIGVYASGLPGLFWVPTSTSGLLGWSNGSWFTASPGAFNSAHLRGGHGLAAGNDVIVQIDDVAATPVLTHRLPISALASMAALSPHDIWYVTRNKATYRCDYAQCRSESAVANVVGLYGGENSGIFANAGSFNSTVWFDGAAFHPLSNTSVNPGVNSQTIGMASPARGTVYALESNLNGRSEVVRWDGGTWAIDPGLPQAASLLSIGVSGSDVWVGGNGYLARQSDAGWVDLSATLDPTKPSVSQIFVVSPTDIFFATGIGIYRWDGAQFHQEQAGYFVDPIFGTGLNDLWLAQDVVWHRNPDTSWTHVTVPADYLPIAGASFTDAGVFVVDSTMGVLHQ